MPFIEKKTTKTEMLPKASITYREDELVGLLRKRSEAGFTYYYENYSAALFAEVLKIMPDHHLAADIVQELFINIYRNIDSYDEKKARLYTWVLRIARNLAFDALRSKGYRNSRQNRDVMVCIESQTLCTVQEIDHIGLPKILMGLKPKYRKLIELSYLQGFTQLEISGMLHIPIGTVKTRMVAAMTQLKEALQSDRSYRFIKTTAQV